MSERGKSIHIHMIHNYIINSDFIIRSHPSYYFCCNFFYFPLAAVKSIMRGRNILPAPLSKKNRQVNIKVELLLLRFNSLKEKRKTLKSLMLKDSMRRTESNYSVIYHQTI